MLALLIPLFVITIVATTFASSFSFSFRDLFLKDGSLQENLPYAFGLFYFYSHLFVLMASKIYYNIFLLGGGSAERLQDWLLTFFYYGQSQFVDFFADMAKIAHGRWYEIPIDSTQRNWTIALSLAFSLTYIVAVAFLLVAKRSILFRTFISRILQYLIEHPKGPVAAVSVVLAAAIFVAKFYLV